MYKLLKDKKTLRSLIFAISFSLLPIKNKSVVSIIKRGIGTKLYVIPFIFFKSILKSL
ncbi:MAG: hypothetical protein QGF65_02500 [Candidatus Pelagibacter bacterium]|nr:hypothetical protein [Candidatus Pelagibacter bacterium]